MKNCQTTLAISAALLAAATVLAPPVARELPGAAAVEKQGPWENREAWKNREDWKNPEDWWKKRGDWWKKQDPSEKAAAAERVASVQKAVLAAHPEFELLSKVVPGLSGSDVSIVDGKVKRFSEDFEDGARNPNRFLPEVRLNQPELLDKWEKTPPEKRIFVIGSGEDFPKLSEKAQSLESEGYTFFFYKLCRPLCSSQAVGAMAGTSGQIILYRTPSAELSKYVEVEVKAARGFEGEGLDKKVVLIPTNEFLAGKFAMLVAEMQMPTPSPVK